MRVLVYQKVKNHSSSPREQFGELFQLLNSRKRSLSSTCMKSTDANNRVYNVNKKTLQALDVLTEECALFEETMKKMAHVAEDGDMLTTVADEITEELEKIQQAQVRRWSSRMMVWTLRPKCSPTVGLICMRPSRRSLRRSQKDIPKVCRTQTQSRRCTRENPFSQRTVSAGHEGAHKV